MKKSKIKRSLAVLLATIIICLSFTGCMHKHTWVEADCTTPKTCSECGEIEGEPLGHTTKFGKCERCGNFIGEEIIKEISNEAESMSNDYKIMSNALNSGYDARSYYVAISSSEYIFDDIETSLNRVIELCSDIPELAEIKSAAQAELNSIPDPISGSDTNSVIDSLEQQQVWLGASADFHTAIADMLDTLLEG